MDEKYMKILKKIIRESDMLWQSLVLEKAIENNIISSEELYYLINYKNNSISEAEFDLARGIIYDTTCYMRFEEINRIILSAIMLDISQLYLYGDRENLYRNFEKYCSKHPIFANNGSLLEKVRTKANGKKDYELMELNAFTPVEENPMILKYNNEYFLVNEYMNSKIIEYVTEMYPDCLKYIRINPYDIYEKRPQSILLEDTMRAANPKWIQKLNIYRGNKEGASYFLPNISGEYINNDANKQKYWEYHVKKIRNLQIVSKRNTNGNLSMMIEELALGEAPHELLGRCIHMDSDMAIGEDFSDAVLNHLDLAINIYLDNKYDSRFNQDLSSGIPVVDASYRTHLFRIENIPFREVINICYLFLQSETLVKEWTNDQFREVDSQNINNSILIH